MNRESFFGFPYVGNVDMSLELVDIKSSIDPFSFGSEESLVDDFSFFPSFDGFSSDEDGFCSDSSFSIHG